MFEFFVMYLVTVIDNAARLIVFLGIISVIVGHVVWFMWGVDDGEFAEGNPVTKYLPGLRKFAILALVVVALVPNRSEVYFIVGGGLALKAIQNEEVQALPENVIRGINGFFKELGEDVPESIEALLSLKTEAELLAEQALEAAQLQLDEATGTQ